MTRQARAERLREIHAHFAPRAATATAEAAPDGAQEATSAELWLYGVVGGYWFGFDAKAVADQLRGLDVDAITVRLHSPGGDALDGIAIGNLLRNHKARVTVVVDGLAASSASVIATAADELVMSPGSQLMLHDPWMLTVGNAGELRADADFLDKQANNYAGIYAHRGGGTAAQWREVMLEETWYSADEAVEAGLADRVGTVTANSAPPAVPDEAQLDAEGDAAARAAWDLEVLVHPAARAAWHPTAAAGTATPKLPSASAVGSVNTTTQEGSPAVAFSDEQVTTMRQRLGLPENADETVILAALDEALDERAEASATTTTTTAAVPEGHVVIPQAALSDLQAGAQAGARAAEQLRTQDRARFLDEHRDRFAPASRAAWERQYDTDPEGTRAYLAAAPVIVPTEELGHDVAASSTTTTDDGWFPRFVAADASQEG